MLIETAKEIGNAIIVIIGAAVSAIISWIPNVELLGAYDKVVSITAGVVAIIVGIMTIINYVKKWTNETG